MSVQNCRFTTPRLLVREWHRFAPGEWQQQPLDRIVSDLLTPEVTRPLPLAWQGPYTSERARTWVRERDREGTTLLAVDRNSGAAVGLIILFESGCDSAGAELRLGYLLAESVWGRGMASELIAGFVGWCRDNSIGSLAGGVEPGNIASARVLEKNGFVRQEDAPDAPEQLFILLFGDER